MKLILLTQGKSTKVDDADFEWLNRWRWRAVRPTNCKTWYAVRTVYCAKDRAAGLQCRHTIQMHRTILPGHNKVDHKDLDGLNNQRANLRGASNSQSSANRGPMNKNGSGFKGIGKARRGWVASIRVNKKPIHLGTFDAAESAARAYDVAALEHFGEFARLNFPDKK